MTTDGELLADLTSRLIALDRRVQLLDDQNAIMQLLYSYGPSVDSGLATVVSGLWTQDGIYDVDTGRMEGRDEIETMVQTHPHQGYIERGCGHVMSPARITITGDTAVAVCHTQLIVQKPDRSGYDVSRVTANRWDLLRTTDGWRVVTRTSRLLDGQVEPRAILASAFGSTEPPGGTG